MRLTGRINLATHPSPHVPRRLATYWSRFRFATGHGVSAQLQRATATLTVLTFHTSGLHARAVTLPISVNGGRKLTPLSAGVST